jgi:hypothetical protein
MRLEDKIRPHALLWDCYNDEPEKYNHTNKLIKIAEEFAIGFAEWFELNSIYNGSEFLIYIEDNKQYKIKEFLEIYKKEKGL